jgi:hypothetical protein
MRDMFASSLPVRATRAPWGALLLALAVMSLLVPLGAFAQTGGSPAQTGSPYSSRSGVEFTALYGYQFGGQMGLTTGGEVQAQDQDAFGFILGVPMGTRESGTMLELSYSHQDTRLEFKDYWQTSEVPMVDLGIDYFQIGGSSGMRRGKALPFGYGTLGATMFNPKGDTYDAEWRFSMTLGVGAKYYASERTGIRVQFGLLIPMQFSSGQMWCGSGGCASSVSGGTTFAQANVSGGLIFLF